MGHTRGPSCHADLQEAGVIREHEGVGGVDKIALEVQPWILPGLVLKDLHLVRGALNGNHFQVVRLRIGQELRNRHRFPGRSRDGMHEPHEGGEENNP